MQFEKDSSVQFSEFLAMFLFFYRTVGFFSLNFERQPNWMAKIAYWLLFHVGIWFLVLAIIGEFIYLFKSLSSLSSFLEATALAPCIAFCLISMVKCAAVVSQKRKLMELIGELKELYPCTKTEQDEFRMTKYRKHITLIMLPFAISTMSIISIFSFYAVIESTVKFVATGTFLRQYPYFIWYPFDTTTVWIYPILYVYQSHCAYVAGSWITATNLLMSFLVNQICMHFDFIAGQMERQVAIGVADRDDRFLNSLILRHVQILRIAKDVNHIFSISTFFNLMSSTLIICVTGFQVSVGISVGDFLKYAMFLFYEMLSVMLICYHGTKLYDSSAAVGHAAYNQSWYEAEISYKRKLLFILTRAGRPCVLNATSLWTVSLPTFNRICINSYQLFALLRTIYHP